MTRQGRTARPSRTNVGPSRANDTSSSPGGVDAIARPIASRQNTPAEIRGASLTVADHAAQAGLPNKDAASIARYLLGMLGLPTTRPDQDPAT